MQQIRQAIKRKQSQLAQLAKEIDLLQQAEETLREIAPLLAEGDEDEGSLLVEVEDEDDGEVAPPLPAVQSASASSASASAGGSSVAAQSEADKPVALRWP
jgi:hypothetical protein